MAYLHKPVIYYQFDDEEFRAYHYQEGYFDYKTLGFGPVCDTEDALLEQISQAFANPYADVAAISKAYRRVLSVT